jgi:hypothetical protein
MMMEARTKGLLLNYDILLDLRRFVSLFEVFAVEAGTVQLLVQATGEALVPYEKMEKVEKQQEEA